MWEEHPWYQKQQARAVGLLVVGLLGLYAGKAIWHSDWQLLGLVLQVAAALVIAMGILTGTAWLLVRICTRRRRDKN